MFEAVCEACGLDTTLLDANTRIAAAKLARELLRVEEPWTPEEVRQAGEDWYGVRWKGKPRSQVTPPQVKQLRTWLGQCEEQRRQHDEYAWAVQR